MSRYAPILQQVAGRIAGAEPFHRTDPMRWAYALRDAAQIAQPDIVVSHVDDRLEADALLASGVVTDDFVAQVMSTPPLAVIEPTSCAVELVRTLVGIYRGGPKGGPVVAAGLTGPATVAARLSAELLGEDPAPDDRLELAELACDALVGLAGAYADAGAALLLVFEPERDFVADADTLRPLQRTAEHLRVELAVASPGIQAEVWELSGEEFDAAFERDAALRCGEPMLSDGPVPATVAPEVLRQGRLAADRMLRSCPSPRASRLPAARQP